MSEPHTPLILLAPLLSAVACRAADPPEVEAGSSDVSSVTDATTAEPNGTTVIPDDTSSPVEPECGNEVLEPGEACDDGDLNGTPGYCTDDCQALVPACGDGLVQGDEACDDGNAIDGDGCNVDCRESGAVLWEHQLDRLGSAYDVAVGTGGAIFVAGQADGLWPVAWAARIDDPDGSVEWTYELATPADYVAANAFHGVTVLGDDRVLLGGNYDSESRLVELDAEGTYSSARILPGVERVDDLAVLRDGDLLVKFGEVASRIDGLVTEWQLPVGYGLAHRPGDDIAVAAVSTSAGFQRFTLDGFALEPVTFSLPEGLSVESYSASWTSTGDIVVAGQVASGGVIEALVVVSSPQGELRWMYGPQQLATQYRRAVCLAVDSQGSIVVGGYAWLLGELRPFLMKLSSEGEVLWTRSLELQATDARVRGCTTNSMDEVIAVGDADTHIWLAKLTP